MLAIAAAAAVTVLLATAPHGPNVTTDSVLYLSTAKNFHAGAGLVSYAGFPLTHNPPGYPLSLAALGGGLVAARILDAVALAVVLVLSWLLLRRHVSSPAPAGRCRGARARHVRDRDRRAVRDALRGAGGRRDPRPSTNGPEPYVPRAVADRVRLVLVRRVPDGALYRVRASG